MEFWQYQRKACKTFKEHKILNPAQAELLDWCMGLAGEAGEVCELVKHNIFHEEQPDKMKLTMELGDVLWYISAIAQSQDIPLGACAALNIVKLEHRHGGKYSHDTSRDRHTSEKRLEDMDIYRTIKNDIEGEE